MIHRLLLLILLAFAPGLATAMDDLPPATGTPLLTISAGGELHGLDAEGLRQMPQTRIETTTIWTEGVQTFVGVRMTEILDRLGVTDGTMLLTAANDYQITVPIADFTPDGAMIAYERNGSPMTLRDKGPLWVVYPFDSDPRFRTEITYANSIWQLDRIEITQ